MIENDLLLFYLRNAQQVYKLLSTMKHDKDTEALIELFHSAKSETDLQPSKQKFIQVKS